MADVQKNFLDFHEKIKLDDENQILREKRDIILEVLKNNISDDAKPYNTFLHGSYSMGTGIKPIDGDYDIDVGVRFEINKDDYTDPVVPKKWVYDAVNGHTKSVEFKNSCIKVQYQKNGEPLYHVDLSVYANKNDDGKMYLAKGKLNSSSENKFWEKSNPPELKETIHARFVDTSDRKQLKRCIRYLKRWKDLKFSSSGNVAPAGIALTVAAYDYFTANYTLDIFTNERNYNDLLALKEMIEKVLNNFRYVFDENEGNMVERLVVTMPIEPYNDLLEKMSNNNMIEFKNKLITLKEKLEKAHNEVDPVVACEELNKVFGDDFIIPEKKENAKYKRQAVAGNLEGA